MTKTQRSLYPQTRPALFDLADVCAIQAVAEGRASPDQQKRAMRWIIEKACMTYDEPFEAGCQDVSAYGCGRRFVGLQIVSLYKLNPNKLKEKKQ